MPTDPKWRVVAKRSGRSIAEVIAVFNFVMVNASGNDGKRGVTHNLFPDDIAAALDIETEHVETIMKHMIGKVMDAKGALTGWEKRQPKREDKTSTDRVRAWREKQAKQTERECNATKRPDTDTDTDTEIESTDPKGSLAPGAAPSLSEARDLYNETAKAVGLPRCQMLTKARKSHLRQRLIECGGIEGWKAALAKVRDSPFCRGDNDKGWRADLDFLVQPKSFTKLMEGAYDHRNGAQRNGKHSIQSSIDAATCAINARLDRLGDQGNHRDPEALPGLRKEHA